MRSVTQILSGIRAVFSGSSIFLVAMLSCLTSLSVYAAPPVENTQCILGQPGAPNGLSCTANDITLSSPTVTIIKGCDFPGDTAKLQVIVDVTNTAQTRYDIGVWLSVDGDPNNDGSESGICSVLTIPTNVFDVDGNSVNLNNNACGDVQQTANGPPDIINVDMGTVDLLCIDSDGDGQLNVPVIIAWNNQAGGTCNVSNQALPNTGSKCRANNDFNLDVPIPARLIVNKNTIPDDAMSFPFNLTGAASPQAGGFDGDHDFNLADNGTFDTGTTGDFSGGLLAGAYVLTEVSTAGWMSTGSCSSDVDGTNTDPATLNLRAGETVTCDYVNVPTTGTLIVRKRTTGGLLDAFDFVVSDTNGPVGAPFTLDTNISNPIDSTTMVLEQGDYDVTETITAGWALTSASCSSTVGDASESVNLNTGVLSDITINPGAEVVCTFANAPLGSVGITKTAVGGDGTFSFNTDVPNPLGANFDMVTANGTESVAAPDISAGTYQITEASIPTGWRFGSATCVDGNQADVSTATVIANGIEFTQATSQTTTCTFVNVKLGTIEINKVTDPGGNVTDSFGFDNDAGLSPATFDLMDGEAEIITNVPVSSDPVLATSYAILEQDPTPGFDLTDVTCTSSLGVQDNLSSGSFPDLAALIEIRAGETVSCTFTNTERASITVEKQISANPNGLSAAFTFSQDFDGSGDFILDPVNTPASKLFGTVLPGQSYTVSEANPNAAGWALISATCNTQGETVNLGGGSISGIVPQAGDDITCTFINAPLGSATIVKNAIGGDGVFGFSGSLEPFNNGGAGFEIDTSVSNSADFTNMLLPATDYDVLESTVPTNWTLTSVVCSDPTDNSTPDGTEELAADPALGALINADVNETVTCTFTNAADAQLTINKVTVPASDNTTEFAFTGTGAINASNLTGGGSVSTMAPAGTFVADETPTVGWTLTNIACAGVAGQNISIGGSAGFIDGDTDVSLALAPGDDATCTYTNTKLGSITITKATVGDIGDFTFMGTDSNSQGIITTPFVLSTDPNSQNVASVTYNGLLPGDYSFAETVPTGWIINGAQGDIACTGQSGSTVTPASASVSIALLNGEDIDCRFTNTKLASLQLVKNVTNDHGGLAVDTDWTLSAAGPTPLSGAGGVAATFVGLGDYTLSESAGPAGYTAGDWSCTDGSLTGTVVTLAAGDVAVCSIINDDDAASLALVKNVTNDDGGTAVANDWTLSATGPTPLSGAGGVAATPVSAGDYVLAESAGPDGYTASVWSCTGGSLNGATLTLALGETASCSITNDDDAASLALVKNVTNDDGGTAVATDWTLSAEGPTPISGAGGVAATPVSAGDYELAETAGPIGYIASAWSCTGGSLNGSTLTLALGETASCSITNDDNAASLALVKNVTNDDGGTAVATDWTLSATGPTPLSGAGGVAATPVGAGDYVLAESAGPDGYTASVWSCTGGSLNGATLTLALGETASCSITNNDEAANLALVKIVSNDNGGTAVATDWTLSAAGPTPLSGAGGVAATPVSAGDYVLAEAAGPDGYTASAWSCTGGSLNGSTLTLALGEIASCSITNNDDAASLALVKNVINNNGGIAVATDWTLSAEGPTPISGAGGVAATPVSAGDYDLSESVGPIGYLASGWSCTSGSLNGSTLTLALGETASCAITNDDVGGGVVADTARLALVKTVTNDNDGSAVATDWTLTAAGPTTISGAGGVAATTVDVGIYFLSESAGPDGYTAGAWSCSAGTLAGSFLTLAADDDAVCTIINDDDPAAINLAKTVNGGATLEPNGTYTVVYTITATNTGGQGVYDLVDAFSPGAGITLNTATAVYVAGTENDQNGALGAYPNFVTGEGLAPDSNESWTVTGNFTVDLAQVNPASSQCQPGAPAINTGFYNAVTGSSTDTDLTDNSTCTGLNVLVPAIPVPVDNKFALILLTLLLLGTGWYMRPAVTRKPE